MHWWSKQKQDERKNLFSGAGWVDTFLLAPLVNFFMVQLIPLITVNNDHLHTSVLHLARSRGEEMISLSSFPVIHLKLNFYLLTATVRIVLSNCLYNALHLTLLHTKWNVMNKRGYVCVSNCGDVLPWSLFHFVCVCVCVYSCHIISLHSLNRSGGNEGVLAKKKQIKGRRDADKITSRCVR